MKVDSILAQASATTATGQSKNLKQLKKSCQELEGMFMNFMLKEMRKTITKSDLFGSNKEEEMFQEMMDSAVCDRAASSQSIGIADLLYKQLSGQITRSNPADSAKTPEKTS